MDNSELLSELLQGLTNDVKSLQAKVNKLPTQPPIDYRTSLEGLSKAVQALQNLGKQTSPAVDLSVITARLDRIEQLSRQQPDRKMSKYIQVAVYAFSLTVVLLAASVWFALTWRSERDQQAEYVRIYARDNWRVRYTQQVNPSFYSYMEGVYSKDPSLFVKWILEQEQADEKRELARRASDQAKALSDQANRLEGKNLTKGKRKG